MEKLDELVKQCMDSGWFTSEENARRYVERYCIPKKVEDVVKKYSKEYDIFDNNNDDDKESLRIERMASPEGL